jgi:hypothetical protein
MISFTLPNGAEFSFPVEWWNEAGMPAFERQSPHYVWDALPELFVRIDAIEPPPMDYEGLDRARMVKVLHAIVSRTALPPVEVEELSLGDYHYRLHHGAHRFLRRCWLHAHSRPVAGLIPSLL